MKMKIGYKATRNLKCETLTYEVGKTYEIDNISMCSHGFHYCPKLIDTLKYYDVSTDLVFIEIEDLGSESECENDKVVTNKIKVLRIVPYEEIDFVKFDGNKNIIYYNTLDF
jgi:hypothetical protein